MITCCKDCVAPKRHIGCHSTCKDYISEKAADAERKAKEETARKLDRARTEIVMDRRDVVAKQNKKYRGYYKFRG